MMKMVFNKIITITLTLPLSLTLSLFLSLSRHKARRCQAKLSWANLILYPADMSRKQNLMEMQMFLTNFNKIYNNLQQNNGQSKSLSFRIKFEFIFPRNVPAWKAE